MRVSVIVRTKDEADRLRLTLTSLSCQSAPAQVIVVDDGSTDHTPAVLAEAATFLSFDVVHHDVPRGRPGASNAGARVASGDILVFLDGDTLAHPELIARHAAVHAGGQSLVGRGETYHLRCTRFLQNPETGSPRAGEESRLNRLPASERARLRITRCDILKNFSSVERRGQLGIYPGAGPRKLCELEIDALRNQPDCGVLWAAASGANQSVQRTSFLRVGGFDEKIDPNEHRELALRLCNEGGRMAFVEGAKSYHMTHRSGWRDPLDNRDWEQAFLRAHPIAAVKLLVVFWSSLRDGNGGKEHPVIRSLPELEAIARKHDQIEAARAGKGHYPGPIQSQYPTHEG